jgi:hypothetical protein
LLVTCIALVARSPVTIFLNRLTSHKSYHVCWGCFGWRCCPSQGRSHRGSGLRSGRPSCCHRCQVTATRCIEMSRTASASKFHGRTGQRELGCTCESKSVQTWSRVNHLQLAPPSIRRPARTRSTHISPVAHGSGPWSLTPGPGSGCPADTAKSNTLPFSFSYTRDGLTCTFALPKDLICCCRPLLRLFLRLLCV